MDASPLLAVLPVRAAVVRCHDGVVVDASPAFWAEAATMAPGVSLAAAWSALALGVGPALAEIAAGAAAVELAVDLAGGPRAVACRRLAGPGEGAHAVVTVEAPPRGAPRPVVPLTEVRASIRCGVVVEDARGQIAMSNPTAAALLGPWCAAGGGWASVTAGWILTDADGHALDPAQLAPAQARAGRTAVHHQVVGVRGPAGDERWLALDAEPLLDDDVGVRAVVTTVTDRTELTVLVRELSTSRARLAEVMDAGDDGYFARDLTTGHVLHSARLNAIVGRPPVDTEADGAAWRERAHADDRPAVDAAYQAVLAGQQERFDLTYRVRHEDGGDRWVRSRGKVVARDRAGRPLRLVGTVTDVDRAQRREAELAASERRIARATASGKVGLWELDLATGVAWRTPRHADIFGDSGPWGLAAFRAAVVPEDRPLVDRAVEVCRRAGDMQFECRIRRGDGRLRWIAVAAEAEVGADGAAVRLVGTVADITERKWIELDLTQVAEQARHRVDALERALADGGAITGLVRICMHCRSVRHDDGSWQHLEAYVAARAPVQFSHGICPTCTAVHYPDR